MFVISGALGVKPLMKPVMLQSTSAHQYFGNEYHTNGAQDGPLCWVHDIQAESECKGEKSYDRVQRVQRLRRKRRRET